MSHRVTTQTDIKEKDLAIQALKAEGWSYTETGDTLHITSGPMRNASLNLRTGNVTGDTDWHSRDTLGALRQQYSVAKVRKEAIKTGAVIESQETMKNGDIRMVLTANFG